MAEKIQQQLESLKATDHLRRELISNVSHDLRTPLASMLGYVDTLLLKNEELDAGEREHYLRITRKHTHRLGDLIGELFELSKLESGSMPINLESFSLAELLQDSVQDFELEARRRLVTIRLEGQPGAAMVNADIALMQRVLENLLRNALKFTPEGGTVTLRIDPHPDRVRVSVADTGRGIPTDQIDNIFDRFYFVAPDGSGHDESSGLGLAIVKRILDLHGSRIIVASEPDHGTRFEFDLPVSDAA